MILYRRTGAMSIHPALRAVTHEIASARTRYVSLTHWLTGHQARCKPAPGGRNAVAPIEHLFRAEQDSLRGLWQALQSHRDGQPLWTGDHTNRNRSIREIVSQTRQSEEPVPVGEAPQMGGTLAFWWLSLTDLQQLAEAFGHAVAYDDLESIIYPHVVLEPLDVRQRFELIRFDLHRHRRRVESLISRLRPIA